MCLLEVGGGEMGLCFLSFPSHSFNNYLLRDFPVTGIIFSTKDIKKMNQTYKKPCLHEAYFLMGEDEL